MVSPEAAPARLGRYELIARLATGGMGEIFLARLEGAAGFEKLVVIKRILPHLADDVRFRGMLIAEARIASVMAHPNICQVHELGETEGQLYIVMEYLEGITMLPLLHRMSKDGRPLEFGFVGGVIQQAIEGLHYAHELKDRSGEYLGIVHRDVTPSNIFLTDTGIAKVLDFGIAKVKDASAHTQTGMVKGKYAYMAPEQLRGASIDRRADVFALGIVLFEMLALRRLFQRKTDYLTFRAVMEQPIPDVRHYRPDCPSALAVAVARALDRDPTKRFATARQFGSAVLDAISQHQRPWTQGELGDFVVANFADNIQKRGAQIASAVLTSNTVADAMPVILPPDAELEISTDNEFPPVDSMLSNSPVPSPEPSATLQALRGVGPEPSATPRLQAVRGLGMTGEQHPVAIPLENSRRSVVWPLVAFAMVAVAGGALFLMWQRTENTPRFVINNGSNSIVTPSESGDVEIRQRPPGPVNGSAAEPRPGSGSGSETETGSPGPGSGPVADAAKRAAGSASRNRTVINRGSDTEVVHRKRAEVNRCIGQRGRPPLGTRLQIVIGGDGRPRSVAFEPDSVEGTPLGACIKGVFTATRFSSGDERSLAVNLREPV